MLPSPKSAGGTALVCTKRNHKVVHLDTSLQAVVQHTCMEADTQSVTAFDRP